MSKGRFSNVLDLLYKKIQSTAPLVLILFLGLNQNLISQEALSRSSSADSRLLETPHKY